MKCKLLTPSRWGLASEILRGGDSKRVSMTSAALAAGVTLKELKGWISRSREHHIEDEPWVWLICEEADDFNQMQAGVLEDKLWDSAMNGLLKEKFNGEGVRTSSERSADVNIGMKLLAVRDERYKKEDNRVELVIDPSLLYQKFLAAQKLSKAKELDVDF